MLSTVEMLKMCELARKLCTDCTAYPMMDGSGIVIILHVSDTSDPAETKWLDMATHCSSTQEILSHLGY
jgi:hypothetical protein